MMPMYAQNPAHGGYMAPTLNATAAGASPPVAVQQVQPQQPQPQLPVQQTSSGMVAHEQNGMVYYYDPSLYVPPATVAAPPQQQQAPPPESYAQPQQGYGVGMVQPGDGSYYYNPHQHHHQPVAAPGAVYYPSQ
jgi:hypothetical protein